MWNPGKHFTFSIHIIIIQLSILTRKSLAADSFEGRTDSVEKLSHHQEIILDCWNFEGNHNWLNHSNKK
ncbi:hypothetical protein BLOT_009903 [Blomia tropicalis]|nr:hypothetical protein BLOT_009903 [Blomia tropicalis]